MKNFLKNSILLFLILLYTAVVFTDRLSIFRTAVNSRFQSQSISKTHRGPVSPPKIFITRGKFVVNTQKLLTCYEFISQHSGLSDYQDNLTAIHQCSPPSRTQTGITQHLPRDPPQV